MAPLQTTMHSGRPLDMTTLFSAGSFTGSNGVTLNYRYLLPTNYDESKKYPLVFFLHGAGERGDDLDVASRHGFMKHVREKGWFDITYLAMDERSTEEIADVVNLVNSIKDENGKSFKLSMAINRLYSIDYFDYFEDLSISSSQRNKLGSLVAERTAKGLSTTFYTCGATAGSLRNQPYETVDFFYFLYKSGCDGYLRWAFDAFPDDPLKDTTHWKFVAGDQNLIYPDAIEENATVRSSVRYQIMIESYKNICALEAISALSEEGASGIKSLMNNFQGYSANMQAYAKAMENGMIKLYKRLLNP